MIVFVAVLFTGVLDCLLPINSFLLITSLVTLIVCGLAGPHCIVSTLPWPHPSHSHLWALYSISNALKSWPYQPTMKHDQKTSAYFTVYSMNSNLFCVKGWSSKHAEGYQGVWSILSQIWVIRVPDISIVCWCFSRFEYNNSTCVDRYKIYVRIQYWPIINWQNVQMNQWDTTRE